jgi:hypothetical protein
MKQSHGRLLQWSTQLSLTRWVCTMQPQNCRRKAVDRDAIGFFHALIPALLVSLLLWFLLLLLF